MPSDFVEARPGDIISSALFNDLLQRLALIEERVDQLEGSVGSGTDPVAITGFEPDDEVAVGQELTILGRGFLFPPVVSGVPTNTVRLNDTQVTSFLFDSSTTRLSFLVPAAAGGANPTNVTVRVSNGAGEAQPRPYRLLPAVPSTVPPPTISNVFPLGNQELGNTIIISTTTTRTAVIRGANFSAQPNENIVQFVVPSSGATVPAAGADPLPVTFISTSEIQVAVPFIAAVPPFGSIPIVLSVRVQGNSTPATRPVNARRG